ncbi:hypothetical protein AOLI_G00166230 [Acnodon oligacanthus]
MDGALSRTDRLPADSHKFHMWKEEHPSSHEWCATHLCVFWKTTKFLGVPPGRGSCPLRGPLPFDLIYTDYHGLQQMKQHMGLSLRKHKCHIRVIDTFGTEPAYNHEEYATLHGYRTNWGYWNLNCRQYMTMFRKQGFVFDSVLCKNALKGQAE